MEDALEPVPKPAELLLRKLWHLRLGVLGAILIAGLVFVAVFAPLVSPHDPYEQNIMARLLPLSWMEGGRPEYVLGTDHVGRDLFSRLVYGARISLTVGLTAVLLQVVVGIALGLWAGYCGGAADSVVSFMVNVMMGFPFILLAMSLVVVLGPSLQNIIIALGLTGWPVFTRVTRMETLRLREQSSCWRPVRWPFGPRASCSGTSFPISSPACSFS